MKIGEIKIDAVRLEEGDWVDNIPEMEGLRLKVRGANNTKWRRLQSVLILAVPRKRRMGGVIDPADQDRITSQCLLNACLLDWSGLEGDDGKPMPYSKEKAEQLLTDPQYRKFHEVVQWAAGIVAETRDSDTKESLKN